MHITKTTKREGPSNASRGYTATTAHRENNIAIRHILRGPTPQAKLTVGAADDVYEKEADRVAEQVMSMPEPAMPAPTASPPQIQRLCAKCDEEV